MRHLLAVVTLCLAATACDDAETAAQPAPVVALMSGSDTAGRLAADLSGARVARLELLGARFCITKAPADMGPVQMITVVADNPDWNVSIAAMGQMPAVGTYDLNAEDAKTYRATITDKSTGDARNEWQRYGSSVGSVMFTTVTANTIAGTFALQASPQWPQSNGPALDVTGNFSAKLSADCVAI